MLKGRTDKRYCDDYCRSAYNNQRQSKLQGANFLRKVNSILRKNRRLLEELFVAGEAAGRVPAAVLVRKGFNFNYLTGVLVDQEGYIYYFCYEYGYKIIGKGYYCIIRHMEIRQ